MRILLFTVLVLLTTLGATITQETESLARDDSADQDKKEDGANQYKKDGADKDGKTKDDLDKDDVDDITIDDLDDLDADELEEDEKIIEEKCEILDKTNVQNIAACPQTWSTEIPPNISTEQARHAYFCMLKFDLKMQGKGSHYRIELT